MNNYLIPANSKKSMLILGYFNLIDLVIFGIGCLVTLVCIIMVKTNNLGIVLLILSPALVTGLLVMPVPNYHNVLTLIKNVYVFFTTRRRFYWKGWCVKDEKQD